MGEFDRMYHGYEDFVDATAAAQVNGYLYGYGKMESLQVEVESFGISEAAKENLLALMRKRTKSC